MGNNMVENNIGNREIKFRDSIANVTRAMMISFIACIEKKKEDQAEQILVGYIKDIVEKANSYADKKVIETLNA